jgi:hypothetical protein
MQFARPAAGVSSSRDLATQEFRSLCDSQGAPRSDDAVSPGRWFSNIADRPAGRFRVTHSHTGRFGGLFIVADSSEYCQERSRRDTANTKISRDREDPHGIVFNQEPEEPKNASKGHAPQGACGGGENRPASDTPADLFQVWRKQNPVASGHGVTSAKNRSPLNLT